jgi:hypothetical protein
MGLQMSRRLVGMNASQTQTIPLLRPSQVVDIDLRLLVSCDISADKTFVTLGFDEFQTYLGRGYAATDRDKNCEIHLNVHYPGGYDFAVVDVTFVFRDA